MVSMRKGMPLTRMQNTPITAASAVAMATPARMPHQPDMPRCTPRAITV